MVTAVHFNHKIVEALVDVDFLVQFFVDAVGIHVFAFAKFLQLIVAAFALVRPVALVEKELVFVKSVVGVDEVFVGAFADVQHSVERSVDEYHRRLVGLVVDVCLPNQECLDETVAQVGAAEVVAGVPQHHALPFQVGFLFKNGVVKFIVAVYLARFHFDGLDVFCTRASAEVADFHFLVEVFFF